MDTNPYVLDANVFIEAAQRYYAFDIAPPFWASLIHHAKSGQIVSIDWVKKELEKGKDELADWAQNEFSNAFKSTDDEEVTRAFSDVMSWVYNHGQYTDYAKSDFAKGGDGWLIAYVKAYGGIIVTHEVLAPNAKKKVPIPNVCRAFDINYIDTFTMLRALGVRFV